jgi:hypothetical protein
MITHTSPNDYQKRVVIVSRLERLCEVCGEHVIYLPSIKANACVSCKRVGDGVEVWEHHAATFRRGLWEMEVEKAYHLVRQMDEQMPTFGGAMDLAEVQS